MTTPSLVLGIETTCDETACAIVRDGKEVLSNVVTSQMDLHELYGGVFPELACRRHIDVLFPILEEALKQAQIERARSDRRRQRPRPDRRPAHRPQCRKRTRARLEQTLIGVNHVEAHIYASMMPLENIPFPSLGVVVSGGHTFLVKMEAIGSYTLIGTTVDDAIGEAFDKVGNLLGLIYPGRAGDRSVSAQRRSKKISV